MKRKGRKGLFVFDSSSQGRSPLPQGEGRGEGIKIALALIFHPLMLSFFLREKGCSSACCTFNAQRTELRYDRNDFLLQQPLRSLRFFAPFAL
jgi:hypothetical protein